MANGILTETTRDWIVVKIPRNLVRAKRKAVLTATKALRIFQKRKEEYRTGELEPITPAPESPRLQSRDEWSFWAFGAGFRLGKQEEAPSFSWGRFTSSGEIL